MTNIFDGRDQEGLRVPAEAFDDGAPGYVLRNHLALEVVAHLAEHGIEFRFQGGTALHTKFATRRRFSVDVDVAADSDEIRTALSGFQRAFPHSVTLVDPPEDMSVDGVRHILQFTHARSEPVEILIEVVDLTDAPYEAEPLHIRADGFDWKQTCVAPTFETFFGQKLGVLCGTTIGKMPGRGVTHNRKNQTAAKQIFDLGELLKEDLQEHKVMEAFTAEVGHANALRNSNHTADACLT